MEKPLVEKYEYNGKPALDRPDLQEPEGLTLSLLAGLSHVRNHALSPNGQWVAFIWDTNDFSDVYILPSQGGWPRRLSFGRGPTISWDDELPAWSRDSHWLAFTQNEHVHVVRAATSSQLPMKITDFACAASSPVWMNSPEDGDKIIVSVDRRGATQLVLTDRHGSWPRSLTDDPSGDAWDPQSSYDGTWIAYVYRPFDDLNRLDLRLIHFTDGAIHTAYSSKNTRIRNPSWSPDSRYLAFLSQASGFYEIWLMKRETDTTFSEPFRLTHLNQDCADLFWSPDSRQIVCTVNRNGCFELIVVNIENCEVNTILGGAGVYSRPQWMPDGTSLTVEYESPLQQPDLFRLDLISRAMTQLTYSMPPALHGFKLVVPRVESFYSYDNLEIPALLHRPLKSNGAGIINPHGGPGDQSIFAWDAFTQYLLSRGFTIIEPNYRGSTGYGLAYERLNYFDWGGGDVQDCLAATDLLYQQPGIDRSRVGSMGASYGGYLTNAALARDPKYRFACGISIFGDANLLTSWAQCSQRLRLYSEIYLGNPADNWQVYLVGSPVEDAVRVRSPLLLLHGLRDDIVPPEASEEWANALRSAGKTYEYKTYANEPHGFLHRANRLDAWQRIIRFLNWHLMPRRITP